MEFEIDNDIWKIEFKTTEELLEIYRKNVDEEGAYAYGVCIYPEHKIYINKDNCKDQQIKTLKHELTHCWIWYSGLYNAPSYTEEMVCDIVANSYNFINEIVDKFKEEQNSIK